MSISEQAIQECLKRTPLLIKQFVPRMDQQDQYRLYQGYSKSDKYNENTMQQIVAGIEGLFDWLQEKRRVIFLNNDGYLLVCDIYKQSKDKRLLPLLEQFKNSFRGGPDHPYKIAFDALTDKIFDRRPVMTAKEAGVDL